jgi:glycosyltransferase involved in cell wall biosynthesis
LERNACIFAALLNMSTPRVSVFMPVYNAGTDLAEAIQSILNQSFRDFEFVIVNDGSTDDSLKVLQSYNDNRIRIINNETNKGLIASLNIGLEKCVGDYIIRMDQDDISLPNRIEKQVSFLDSNSDYGLIGTWFEDFGEHIDSKTVRYSPDDTEIRIRHLYQTHISHPTAAIRTSVLRQNQLLFDPEFVHGEDYEFWVRLSEFCKLSNIQELLVRKRDHPKNISNKYAQTMQDTCAKVKQKQFRSMGIELSVEEIILYERFANIDWSLDSEEMNQLLQLLEKILQANEESGFIPKADYRKYLALRFFHLSYNNKKTLRQGWKNFHKSVFSKIYEPSIIELLKFRIKTIFG